MNDRHHACRHAGSAGPFVLPDAPAHYPPDLRVEPVHMRLELSLDIPGRTLDGCNTLTVRGRSGGKRLVLHAVDFDGVEVTGDGCEARYDGDTIEVRWATPFAEAEEREVTVTWRAVEPASGLFFSSPTEHEPDAPTYAATDNETERARHWMPCVDLPSVRPTLEIRLRAPAGYTALANGRLVDELSHDDGTATRVWKLDAPCPSYITCFVVGELVRFDDEAVGDVPVSYFTSQAFTPAHLERTFGPTPEMLAWMQERLGVPYPYPKYFQFALPGFGGAMENISLVSWDDIFVLDETLAAEWRRLIDQINVHEMAHSWFGDLVVCRDFAHAWLKESWATYMEQVWFEDRDVDEGRYEFQCNAEAYFEEADEKYKRPLVTREFHSSWQMYDRHLYPGGACRLHTLRHLLGDEIFWRGVHTYLDRGRDRPVETADFRRVMEETSGRSLGRFFDQWIHGKGYPHLSVQFRFEAERGRGVFEIEQKQVDAEAGVSAFELEIEVGWVIDGQLHTHETTLRAAREVVVVPLSADPEQVRVDPHGRVLHKLDFDPGYDKLRAQLTGAEDVVGRILAGRTLIASGKRRGIEAVDAAWAQEPFWGVRAEWARSLGEAATAPAVALLRRWVAEEAHPNVIGALMKASALRDAALAEAIEARVDGGLPYWAHRHALAALAAQRDDAPLGPLLDAAQAPSQGGILQSGAFLALGQTGKKKARKLLERAILPGGADRRARPSAVTALGTLAARLKSEARRDDLRAALKDRLRDPNDRVQQAAARALAAMGATASAGALEAWGATRPAQERAANDARLAGLRKKERGEGDGKTEELEKLQGRLRDLEARLQKLEAVSEPDDA